MTIKERLDAAVASLEKAVHRVAELGANSEITQHINDALAHLAEAAKHVPKLAEEAASHLHRDVDKPAADQINEGQNEGPGSTEPAPLDVDDDVARFLRSRGYKDQGKDAASASDFVGKLSVKDQVSFRNDFDNWLRQTPESAAHQQGEANAVQSGETTTAADPQAAAAGEQK